MVEGYYTTNLQQAGIAVAVAVAVVVAAERR